MQDVWLRKRTKVTQESRLTIRIILRIAVAVGVCRIAVNFPHQTIFRREEICGIAATAQIAGICKIKRSEKSLNAAKCSKKNILTVD